jgi:hypothetical protein
MRTIAFAALALVALVVAPLSSAKQFDPGDLRLCNGSECAVLVDRDLLRRLSSFIYGHARPVRAAAPARGAPALELTFRNGYVAGLVGGTQLDRFRSHGVICGRFRKGWWYRLPPRVAHDLRRAAGRLTPLRFTGSVPRSC